jgi:hypothetical protein
MGSTCQVGLRLKGGDSFWIPDYPEAILGVSRISSANPTEKTYEMGFILKSLEGPLPQL